ncbi:MAG: hypothetical protein ACI8YI_002764, partial [Paracoccaceae bacterium]
CHISNRGFDAKLEQDSIKADFRRHVFLDRLQKSKSTVN